MHELCPPHSWASQHCRDHAFTLYKTLAFGSEPKLLLFDFLCLFFMECVCERTVFYFYFWELSQISLLVHLSWMWRDDLINELVAFGDVCKLQLPQTSSRTLSPVTLLLFYSCFCSAAICSVAEFVTTLQIDSSTSPFHSRYIQYRGRKWNCNKKKQKRARKGGGDCNRKRKIRASQSRWSLLIVVFSQLYTIFSNSGSRNSGLFLFSNRKWTNVLFQTPKHETSVSFTTSSRDFDPFWGSPLCIFLSRWEGGVA